MTTGKTPPDFHQMILDAVADPIMVIDPDFQVMLVNRAAQEFSSLDQIPSGSISCYQLSHNQDVPCDGIAHPCPLKRVRETRQQVTVIHEHFRPDGEKRLVEIVASPLWGGEGTFLGIVEAMRDVTERERAELDRVIYTERLRALAAKFTEVVEIERQRLARELHDRVGQNLSALAINLNIIKAQMLGEQEDLVRPRLEDSLLLVEETTAQIRDVMTRLRPPILDDCGLIAALLWYGNRFTKLTGIPVTVDYKEPEQRMPARAENALFRISQEALTNVARHAEATSVAVTVEVNNDMLRLVIADDGVGFFPSDYAELDDERGWGLLTMIERAEAVGGRCQIESTLDQGTKITVEVPR